MRKVFAVILKFIATLLAALTIIATIFILIIISFNRTILNPQIVRQAFIKNKVYEQVPVVVADEFSLVKGLLVDACDTDCADGSINASQSNATSTGKLGIEGTAFLSGLNQDQWSALMHYALTPDDVQKGFESGADEFIAYFKGETDTVKIPLTDLKARLGNIPDEQLPSLLLNSQPACSLEQQTLIMSGGVGEVGSPPIFCSATEGTLQVLVLDLKRRLNIVASEIPEHIVLIKPPSPSNPSILQKFIGRDLRATLQKINANSQNLPFIPFALLLLVTLFGIRSLRGLLRWWGIPIFIASLITLIIGLIIFFTFDRIWLNHILTHLPPILTSGFGEIIYDLAHSLSNDFSKQMMLEAGIVTLLALGVILVSNRVPPPPDPSLPPLAQPGTPGGPVLNPQQKKKRW